MLKLFIILIVVVFYKFLVNFIRYNKLNKYKNEYLDYLANKDVNPSFHKNEIMQLLQEAGVNDVSIPISQPTGYGMVATQNVSIMLNYPTRIAGMVGGILELFDNGIGEYKKRYIESFSPLFWIDFVMFFPKHLLNYIKIDKEKYSYKILNIILTLIYWVIIIFCTVFKEWIIKHIEIIVSI